ncbi:class I SAM-dependent methyltransferase [Massilia sp. CMS3.1]|uniref:class I SAM-dependent methyltransferase n=1 Tax=Massilia sp. CMS3.1 TaxID=3373083 RepID=UPI003EE4F039
MAGTSLPGFQMNNQNYLPDVKAQYERLPYPPVNPLDEHRRLQRTWLEDLPMINHYCFGGRQTFTRGFRVLVAGGGTGDATIFLAEQLRATNAEIVHLDLSMASIKLAQQRAQIRRLTNIRWVNDSILNLPHLDLGRFDYINCSGVLHHLADPDAGLRALESVLAERGAIALMVYGAIGRTGVYHMQQLLRLANEGCGEEDKVRQAKEVLNALPNGNWYHRAGDLYGDNDTDAGIYDSLLHTQDRAYTIEELHAWLGDGHGFTLALSDVNRGRFPYLPELTLGREARQLRARLPSMSERARHAMSELLMGDIIRHNLYLTPDADAQALYGQADFIPFYFHEPLDPKALAKMFEPKHGALTILAHPHLGLTAAVDAGLYAGQVLGHIDGMRTFGEIFNQVRAGLAGRSPLPDNATLFADFAPVYDLLNAIERLLLRHVICR